MVDLKIQVAGNPRQVYIFKNKFTLKQTFVCTTKSYLHKLEAAFGISNMKGGLIERTQPCYQYLGPACHLDFLLRTIRHWTSRP